MPTYPDGPTADTGTPGRQEHAADPVRSTIAPAQISGVVLAGGRGARMGGVDKGLQAFNAMPLAQHALLRLQGQVGASLINANRNLERYQAFAVPVHRDSVPDFAGPLAGFVSALEHCTTPYLATVPCDSPLFPLDLVARLAHALEQARADIAVASIQELDRRDGRWRWRAQPVFCLLRTSLLPDLREFLAGGGRKIDAWIARHANVAVPFEDARAFANANTLAELQTLQG